MQTRRTIHIGLGEVGSAVAVNLLQQGYDPVGFDVAVSARENAKEEGIASYQTLSETIASVSDAPRIVFVAIPAEYVSGAITDLLDILDQGDIIVDISNSFFKSSIEHHQRCKDKGISFVDCGLSAGAEGAQRGASLLVGGEAGAIQIAMPVLQAIAREARCAHVGGPGSGHFTKMVHDAIEYSMMGAIAEGFYILDEHKGALDLDIKAVLEPYAEGSVISGQLLRWLKETYQTDSQMRTLGNSVPPRRSEVDLDYLTKHEVARILDAALIQRKLTRLEPSVIGRIINGMDIHFGDAIGKQVQNKEQSKSIKSTIKEMDDTQPKTQPVQSASK